MYSSIHILTVSGRLRGISLDTQTVTEHRLVALILHFCGRKESLSKMLPRSHE